MSLAAAAAAAVCDAGLMVSSIVCYEGVFFRPSDSCTHRGNGLRDSVLPLGSLQDLLCLSLAPPTAQLALPPPLSPPHSSPLLCGRMHAAVPTLLLTNVLQGMHGAKRLASLPVPSHKE
ncbi:hypothetical protein Emed_005191 [Eimeria media]